MRKKMTYNQSIGAAGAMLSALLLGVAGTAQATEINWQYAEQMYQDSGSEAFINTNGTFVMAFSSGASSGETNTINGVDFINVNGTNLYHGVTNNGVVFSLNTVLSGTDAAFGSGSFGAGAIRNVIQGSVYGLHTVTITNLTEGEWYMMQVLVNDARGNRNASFQAGFSDGENSYANSVIAGTAGIAKLNNGSESSGDSIIGYFEADSSGSVSYEVTGTANDWSGISGGRAQLNGFQLRMLAEEPELDLRPAIPSGLVARPTGPTAATLTWSEANGADSYMIKRSTVGGGPYTTIETGFTDLEYTDLVPATDTTYYYVVSSTNEHGESVASSSEFAAVVINATIIYSYGSDYGSQYEAYSLFDDNLSTHYDSAVDAWAGLDYGAGNEREIVEIHYALRTYSTDVTVLPYATNAMFQAANSSDWSDVVTLHTCTNFSRGPAWNEVDIVDATSYRYVRILAASGLKNKAFAEILFLSTDDFTANHTPKYWLDEQYDIEVEFGGDYEAADTSDTDNDALTAGDEYVAATDPNNGESVLKINSMSMTNGLVISWQSVAGKSYSIVTNTSLTYGTPGAMASDITGLAGETSYTGTVSGSSAVFYEISVE